MHTSLHRPVIGLAALAVMAACAQGITASADPFQPPDLFDIHGSPVLVLAHAGGLAADGCHKDNAAGIRHGHKDGTAEAAFECIDQDGQTLHVPFAAPAPAPAPEVPGTIESLTNTIAAQARGLVDERDALRARVADLEADLEGAHAAHAETLGELDVRSEELALAEATVADLDARWDERPIVRCRNAASVLADREERWLGGVLISAEEQRELRAACLGAT